MFDYESINQSILDTYEIHMHYNATQLNLIKSTCILSVESALIRELFTARNANHSIALNRK